MRILALETTERVGSIALLEQGISLNERRLPASRRTAQVLVPSIGELLAEFAWRPADLGLIAVSIGPGSFTGLRIGVVAAKSLAYAIGAQVLGVDTLATIAEGLPDGPASVAVAIDAQREEVFAAHFQRQTSSEPGICDPRASGPIAILARDAWFQSLRPPVVAVGNALARMPKTEESPAGVEIADRELWAPRAAVVGRLAWRDFQSGRREDLWQLVPNYMRKSYAEETYSVPISNSAGVHNLIRWIDLNGFALPSIRNAVDQILLWAREVDSPKEGP